MSNPHNFNDDQTRQFRPSQGGYSDQRGYPQDGYGGYPQDNYSQGYQQAPPQQAAYQQQGDPDWGKKQKSGLIAGRFDATKVIVNLIVLGVLAAAVTFAAVFIVDLLLSQFTGVSSGGVGTAIVTGVIAGIVGVLAGLLYIPVVGTGNEHLYGLAVIALAVVAAIVWVLLGGLLDGDWRTLITLTGIVATAMTAYASRQRIEAADVRGGRY